jgi:hypothetical protein
MRTLFRHGLTAVFFAATMGAISSPAFIYGLGYSLATKDSDSTCPRNSEAPQM